MLSEFTLQESKDLTLDNVEERHVKSFHYLSLVTDYTSRILKQSASLYKCIDQYWIDAEVEIQVLLIEDHFGDGSGLYFQSADLDKVKAYNRLTPISCGSVVFYSQEAQTLSQWLRFVKAFLDEVKYCQNYGIDNVEQKDDVLEISYDTESG